VAPSGGASDELESLVSDLGLIAERIADLAMQTLREAISRREQSRPQLEKELTRARHAVERAIGILTAASELESSDPDEGEP
jgi:hypothetical protein